MVVLVGWIGGGGALKEGDAKLALAAKGDALIVDDFGKRQAGGDEVEGVARGGVAGGVEAGEAEVEVGFEGEAVGGRDLGEGRGRGIEVAVGVLGLAKGEECGGIGRSEVDGGLEALEALGGVVGVVAADVVLEGGKRDGAGAGGGEEGLLGDGEVGVDGAGELPGDGVLDVVEAGELGGVFYGGGESEVVDGEDLGLDGDAVAGDVVAADEDEVGVELLSDADGGGAGGLKSGGRPRWSSAKARSSREMVRKPEELRRLLRVSGKESPTQFREGLPERFSKGRTRTTRPPVSVGSCARASVEAKRPARARRRARGFDGDCIELIIGG